MRILIVGPAWVGDMVIAGALTRALRESDPDAELHLLAPPSTVALGERLQGVHAIHPLPVGHGELGLGRRCAAARALRGLDFVQAIVLPNSAKSALVPWLAGIPRRTGWRGEWRHGLLNDLRAPAPARYPRLVDRFLALGVAPDAAFAPMQPRLRADAERGRALLAELGLVADGRVLGCCPGAAYGPAKRWPAAHWSELARHWVTSTGGAVWLFGAPADAAMAADIHAGLPPEVAGRVHDLSGRTGLLDAVDLLAYCDAVVSNDSGLMHVAAALGRPVIGLYGSSTPAFTPPLGERAATLSLELDCSPCFQRTCPLGHTACLVDLAPARVIGRLQGLLGHA